MDTYAIVNHKDFTMCQAETAYVLVLLLQAIGSLRIRDYKLMPCRRKLDATMSHSLGLRSLDELLLRIHYALLLSRQYSAVCGRLRMRQLIANFQTRHID